MVDINDIISKHKQMIEDAGGYAAVSERILLFKVYGELFFFLDKAKGETIELHHRLSGNVFAPIVDIYLPLGCTVLDIPAQSYINLKARLIHNTLKKELDIAQDYQEQIGQAFFVYASQGDVNDAVLKDVQNNSILTILSETEFSNFLNRYHEKRKVSLTQQKIERKWKEERKQILDNAHEAVRTYRTTFVLGAGVSASAGGPSWDKLLKKVIREFKKTDNYTAADIKKLSTNLANSSIILGRYALPQNERSQRYLAEFLQKKVLYRGLHESPLVTEIVSECLKDGNNVESIITYNYDDIIEQEFDRQQYEPWENSYVSIYEKDRALSNQIPIYHVHGYVPKSKQEGLDMKPVFSESEYHAIYKEAFQWSNIEQLHAFNRNTCIFIGLSMTDPNLRRLLDISLSNSDGEAHHYVFLQRNNLSFRKSVVEKNRNYFEIQTEMYQHLGLNVIWYEDHDEIPKMLKSIFANLQLIG